ncbi:MAG: hypothetical protein ACRES3_11000 [Steroidobacteraceae bacterium]
MRIVSRTTRSLLEQKREKSLQKRAKAGALSKAFPNVEQVHVQLRFIATANPMPAAQVHALYPSAHAYFEFPCPYGDCDGSFDLNGVALPLLGNSAPQAEGTLQCSGSRTAGGMTRQPCKLRADYWISAKYQSIIRAAG